MATLYNKRGSEFWEEAIVALVRCLGVYPPSSIVELTDGCIGIVTSINSTDRMRPSVLLYTPEIPKHEATILDLSKEPHLSITRSLRPDTIPTQVWDYLNPRGNIRYFSLPAEPNPSR